LRNAIRGTQRKILQPLLAQASKLVATAKFEIDLFGRTLGIPTERFAYIPNGSDIATQNISSQHIDSNAPLIISVGRLERYKGHQRAIAAMPALLKEFPHARLRVLGAGPYEAELNALVRKLGLTNCVEVRSVPPTQRQAMANTLAQASLVVAFSEYETHPMAVLEALALKRSVLLADTSGLSELAHDGYARAIPINSTPEHTAAAMAEQLRHPHIPKHMQLSTWDDCTRDLIQMYQSVLRAAPVNTGQVKYSL
jgi:glycosyltransferase involved in cell wall biosynthesis